MCGECCTDPKLFWLYKIFEPNLAKDDSNTPCDDIGLGKYEKTEVDGMKPIAITVDMYS